LVYHKKIRNKINCSNNYNRSSGQAGHCGEEKNVSPQPRIKSSFLGSPAHSQGIIITELFQLLYAASSSHCTASSDRVIVKNEMKRMWREMVMASHSPADTEKYHKETHS
jgi:hypothetical protein